ncbi:hypothetical protein HOLleu_21699 [Holothuria leucospilota]|uniref:G-protein coupled receptors family 1 profile domain-containing protein n=1 Tax=Holothuria leucospilota TaxID=206669 RepID=A0A9Q1BXT4_HOLLE|nr:hypothetical protein HOLleu_21699 [Holothuria leucospilota]
MLPSGTLRVILWLVGSVSLLANFAVIVSRIKSKNYFLSKILLITTSNNSQNTFLLNLSISDFLMGVYLFAIGSADVIFGKGYIVSALRWRTGITCKIIGFVGVVSNVASLLILSLISIERFVAIVLPFCRHRFGSKFSKVSCAIVWVLSVVMALTPIILSDFVEGVFGLSDICSGLPFVTITSQEDSEIITKYESGKMLTELNKVPKTQWIYSQIVYIYFSATCVSVVTICYVSMFVSAKITQNLAGRNANNAEELKMAAKMSIIVGTDLLCWVPIITAGILTDIGTKITIELYAWLVVVVMPINSALNPFIYTIPLMKRKKKNEPSFIGEQRQLKENVTDKLQKKWIASTSVRRLYRSRRFQRQIPVMIKL